MKISNRINKVKTSPVRKLLPYVDDALKKGKKVYKMNIGQPDLETPKEFLKAIKSYENNILEYENSRGKLSLINEIIKYYEKLDATYTSEEVLITNGGSEAIMFTLLTLFDEGDEIIIPEPYYANYNSYFDLLDIKVVPIKTKIEDNYHLPNSQVIEELVTEKTKAIMITNPSNPSGVVYNNSEVEMINDIAKRKGLFIIADEVYREFCYTDKKPRSFASYRDIDEYLIIIDSISKRFSACGARIGCLISKNKIFMMGALKLCQARLAVPTLEMVGAEALYKVSEKYLEGYRYKYFKRREIMIKELNKIPNIKFNIPEGAFYLLVKLPIENSEKFIIWLLENFEVDKETLVLTPAEDFYKTEGIGHDEIRISYAIDEDDIRKAINILGKSLAEYKNN